MKKQPKLAIIKPVLGTNGVSDTDFISRLTKVHDGLLNNPAYPSPPVDMAGFKAAIDAYATAEQASLDGGKSAMTALEKQRANVTIMYRLLGHYVESACKNDMTTFVSSGFIAAAPVQRSPAAPVTVPTLSSVDQGVSGQLLVTMKAVTGARSYDIRYAPVPAAGATVTWTMVSVATVKPAVPINNLTPGTTYTFQVRAFGKLGYSEWGDPINRMTT